MSIASIASVASIACIVSLQTGRERGGESEKGATSAAKRRRSGVFRLFGLSRLRGLFDLSGLVNRLWANEVRAGRCDIHLRTMREVEDPMIRESPTKMEVLEITRLGIN